MALDATSVIEAVERRRRNLLAGGAIASGVSLALPIAGAALVVWRRVAFPWRALLMPIQWPFRPRPDSSRSDLWTKCPGCSEMVYNKQLEENQRVCPKCGHHFRLRVDVRLGSLLDRR